MKNSEAILVTPKHFEIQECPVPEPKDHEILMKVEYVGMCGSDIHGFEFGPFIPPKDPNQKIGLGHEVAGEVVKIGAKVTKFKVGDKVLIEPGVPDDTCEYCRTGRYNICPGVDFMATQPNYKGGADTVYDSSGRMDISYSGRDDNDGRGSCRAGGSWNACCCSRRSTAG